MIDNFPAFAKFIASDFQDIVNQPPNNVALDVVVYVIQTLRDEEEATKKRAENKMEREKLLKILAEKQDGKLSELSEKELQRRINALE